MYELKKNGNLFTSKYVGTGPSSYEKRSYRAAVSQRLTNTGQYHDCVYNLHVAYNAETWRWLQIINKVVSRLILYSFIDRPVSAG